MDKLYGFCRLLVTSIELPVGVRGQSEMFFTFNPFFTLSPINSFGIRIVDFLQQDIASAFAGRFGRGRKAFGSYVTDLKTVGRWRYDWRTNKNFKI